MFKHAYFYKSALILLLSSFIIQHVFTVKLPKKINNIQSCQLVKTKIPNDCAGAI